MCGVQVGGGEISKMIMRDGHVWDTERGDYKEALVIPFEMFSALLG